MNHHHRNRSIREEWKRAEILPSSGRWHSSPLSFPWSKRWTGVGVNKTKIVRRYFWNVFNARKKKGPPSHSMPLDQPHVHNQKLSIYSYDSPCSSYSISLNNPMQTSSTCPSPYSSLRKGCMAAVRPEGHSLLSIVVHHGAPHVISPRNEVKKTKNEYFWSVKFRVIKHWHHE